MSAVFPASAAQGRAAEGALARREAELKAKLHTLILPLGTFYQAEDYHQKYYLRSDRELMRELQGYSDQELAESRVAARLNGYIGGEGSSEDLEREIAAFGLSPQGEERLRAIVRRST
jgi:peptide-methionine (S)-S-oxide reductase